MHYQYMVMEEIQKHNTVYEHLHVHIIIHTCTCTGILIATEHTSYDRLAIYVCTYTTNTMARASYVDKIHNKKCQVLTEN